MDSTVAEKDSHRAPPILEMNNEVSSSTAAVNGHVNGHVNGTLNNIASNVDITDDEEDDVSRPDLSQIIRSLDTPPPS